MGTYRKKGKYLYRKRAMYAYSEKSTKQGTVVRWIRTKYYRWVGVQWRWTRHTKVKKGVSYRRQGMYGYSKTKKSWYRTNRIRWRRATQYQKTKQQREAMSMEEVQGRSEAQSEEASQAGWGSRRRRRRRRRRRWWGSHHERHQKNVARERANKERSVKAKERSVKAKAPKKWKWGRKYKKKSGKLYRMRVLYRKPGNKWLATNKKYWRRVMWSWRRTYRKKGKYLYRKRAMYAYSKKSTKQGTVVRWIRTKYY